MFSPERVAAALQNVTILKQFVADPSAVAYRTRNVRHEQFSNDTQWFTTELFVVNISLNRSFYDAPANRKQADEFYLPQVRTLRQCCTRNSQSIENIFAFIDAAWHSSLMFTACR